MLIICVLLVFQEKLYTKLKEVARMIKSLITANPLIGIVLMVAGVTGSSSPA